MNLKTNIKLLGALIIGISLTGANVFADNNKNKQQISSSGGIAYGTPNDMYWFKLGGTLAIDHTTFLDNLRNRKNDFLSGAKLKTSSVNISGGIGNDISYTMTLDMGDDRNLKITDASATYSNIGIDKFNFSIGQINSSFSLEGSGSSAFAPFLNKSMPTTTFGPASGLGISINKWDINYSIKTSVFYPRQGDKRKMKDTESDQTSINKSDQWSASTRITFTPIKQDDNIIQLGISGSYDKNSGSYIRFNTTPEVATRSPAKILDTNYQKTKPADTRSIQAKNNMTISADISSKKGPLHGELEYHHVNIKQTDNDKNLKFYWWHAQTTYTIKGIPRTLNEKSGWGQVKSDSKHGAWEIGIRHSYINLNSNNIKGGSASNITVGLNWYPNNATRLTANFIHSKQKLAPVNKENSKQNTNILSLRYQLKF